MYINQHKQFYLILIYTTTTLFTNELKTNFWAKVGVEGEVEFHYQTNYKNVDAVFLVRKIITIEKYKF